MFVRAYLRASTEEQDASRARADLDEFARGQGLNIAAYYVENESGASLKRPELFRLLSDCQQGDVLLVEQVDRLSRLNASDWESLKGEIARRGVRVVALDLPTSWIMMKTDDELTTRMMDALNGMMLDMLAAIARKDYSDRRRRQAQGIAEAKAKGKYRGRPVDKEKHQNICNMLEKGHSWSDVAKILKVSRSTIARAVKG
ncbi:recombinase family protein [Marinobacter salarius]|uniref:recombinase family protein n=1 Tax=Marinobacter salarius TaxID=1420917 RepID=UPI00273C96E5|nr:recombinase family protein [Marinobacter salarius]MDP4532518.1 recombinase family protein [Marinobacter salarius]